MADTEKQGREQGREPGRDAQPPETFDRDINMKAVVATGVGLAAVTAVAIVLMWFLFRGMESYMNKKNPPPPPIPEATQPPGPPGPRLQATPEEDLKAMRAQEHALLEGYSLVEKEGGYARIPIERAMQLVLGEDLSSGPGPAPAIPNRAGMPEPGDSPEAAGTTGGGAPPQPTMTDGRRNR